MEGWQALIQRLEITYYTDLIMWIVELTAIAIGLKYVRTQKIGKLFLLYLIFDFITLTSFFLATISEIEADAVIQFATLTNSLICLIELFTYFVFFSKTIEDISTKNVLAGLFIVFFIVILLYILTGYTFFEHRVLYSAYILNVIEFLFLIVACAAYYHRLIQKPSVYNLFHRPSFWITTGIFFYSAISIPYHLLSYYLHETNNQHQNILGALLFNISFTINFIFLSKAFLLKRVLII